MLVCGSLGEVQRAAELAEDAVRTTTSPEQQQAVLFALSAAYLVHEHSRTPPVRRIELALSAIARAERAGAPIDRVDYNRATVDVIAGRCELLGVRHRIRHLERAVATLKLAVSTTSLEPADDSAELLAKAESTLQELRKRPWWIRRFA